MGAAVWLDGLIVGLGLGAVAAAAVLGPIMAETGDSFAVVATNLAYPVGDLLLFVVVISAVGLTGWRPGWMWALLALGLIVQRRRRHRLSVSGRDRHLHAGHVA